MTNVLLTSRGDQIHYLRHHRLHITQQQLAHAAGIPVSKLSKLECGKQAMDDEMHNRLLYSLNAISFSPSRRKQVAYPGQTGLPL